MAALRFFFYLLMKPATLGMTFLGVCGIFAPCIHLINGGFLHYLVYSCRELY